MQKTLQNKSTLCSHSFFIKSSCEFAQLLLLLTFMFILANISTPCQQVSVWEKLLQVHTCIWAGELLTHVDCNVDVSPLQWRTMVVLIKKKKKLVS